MHILLNPTSNKPIYEQIIQQVKERILQGVVVAGDKVPSVREMSAQLTVNPNTVSKAYKELEREGIFVTFRGKGTFISEDVHELVQEREVKLLKEQAEKLVQSAKQAGISKEEMKQWIDELFQQGGGERD
ncbi:GntR family transcriptional regulator [Alkalibacillus filiformis]|uniref:GntR family transcriptional regulator n=1 Tax=Alkalibacillus filiformis TaxID=200990 RepID=A0ABU0DX77_9BACI|nr:GntR family transcriptional regulator [Alkalibacillus filiformis]MDQ0353074.1 GntR family transcriptional regulator [Alkalibacillus filiformis]